MQTKQLEIINKLGLHARAANKFVTTAMRFESRIQVSKDGKVVDGKSIMSVMMLAAAIGSVLEISTEGADELDAMAALEALILDKFGEGE